MTPSSAELIERFGTPLYVYRTASIRAAVDRLRAALPRPHRLFYSLKANPNIAIVETMTELGLHAEVSSSGELAVALTAGQPPGEVLYTGPGKTQAEVLDAIRLGVRQFSVESAADHRRLLEASSTSRTEVSYLVRVNGPRSVGGGGLRMTGRPSQFGVDLGSLWDSPQLFAATTYARPVGLHLFPVTNVADEDVLATEFATSISVVAKVLDRTGLSASLVDLGGGFAAPFALPGGTPPTYDGLAAALGDRLDAALPRWRQGSPAVAFESGRYLTSECGTLLATVLDVKQNGGKTFVVLDAGINALGGISASGRLRPPQVRPAGAGGTTPVALVGPLCTPVDLLGSAVPLDEPKVGAVVQIPNVGAYGLTASVVGFLSRPLPTEVVLDEEGAIITATRLELRTIHIGLD